MFGGPDEDNCGVADGVVVDDGVDVLVVVGVRVVVIVGVTDLVIVTEGVGVLDGQMLMIN